MLQFEVRASGTWVGTRCPYPKPSRWSRASSEPTQEMPPSPLLSLSSASHKHPWLQNRLHFFIKSESPREGMTWLLQLIFFFLFQIRRFNFLWRRWYLVGGWEGVSLKRRAAFECLVLIADRDQHGKSSLSPQYGRESVWPGLAYQTACQPLS